MKITDLIDSNGFARYGKEIYYLLVAGYSDEKYIESIDFTDEEMMYLVNFLKNVKKEDRIDLDIEGFIILMRNINRLSEQNIHLSSSDTEEVMDCLCNKYNKHFDIKCDLFSYIKGYYYNRGNLSGIKDLINNLYEEYLLRVEKDKECILEGTKGYNHGFQLELIKMYLQRCYSVKKILENLPSKEIIDKDYKSLEEEKLIPLCVTLYDKYLSGNVNLDGYSNDLGSYNLIYRRSIPVPYTKQDFLNSLTKNKQKIL